MFVEGVDQASPSPRFRLVKESKAAVQGGGSKSVVRERARVESIFCFLGF